MGALTSRSKKVSHSRVTSQDRAILELKKQRDQLKLYRKKIDAEQAKLRMIAQKLLAHGEKSKALLILKKKKKQEALAEKTAQQIDNLESLADDIEFSQIEGQVLEGLKEGNQALKDIHKLLSLEEAEKIMEDTREALEYQEQLNEILSGNLTNEDESDILAEFHLLAESTEEELVNFPDVPSHKPVLQSQKKDLTSGKEQAMVSS